MRSRFRFLWVRALLAALLLGVLPSCGGGGRSSPAFEVGTEVEGDAGAGAVTDAGAVTEAVTEAVTDAGAGAVTDAGAVTEAVTEAVTDAVTEAVTDAADTLPPDPGFEEPIPCAVPCGCPSERPICRDGSCAPRPPGCLSDWDCGCGEVCEEGVCGPPPRPEEMGCMWACECPPGLPWCGPEIRCTAALPAGTEGWSACLCGEEWSSKEKICVPSKTGNTP